MGSEGRVVRRLRTMLEAQGWTDVRLYPALGAYRTDTRIDCYRWTGYGIHDGVRQQIQSWRTMSELINAGDICVDDEGDVIPAT